MIILLEFVDPPYISVPKGNIESTLQDGHLDTLNSKINLLFQILGTDPEWCNNCRGGGGEGGEGGIGGGAGGGGGVHLAYSI